MTKSYDDMDREELLDIARKQSEILARIFPDKGPPDHCFITGVSEDQFGGMPRYLYVCPCYGLDGFAVYKLYRDYDAPGW
jgi:hypothetical protein